MIRSRGSGSQALARPRGTITLKKRKIETTDFTDDTDLGCVMSPYPITQKVQVLTAISNPDSISKISIILESAVEKRMKRSKKGQETADMVG